MMNLIRVPVKRLRQSVRLALKRPAAGSIAIMEAQIRVRNTMLLIGPLHTFIVVILFGIAFNSHAGGVYGNGVGAQSMSMGGADVASAESPLGAMGENPAGLAFMPSTQLDLGVIGGITQGQFNKPGVSEGHADSAPGALPETGLALPLGKWPVTLGLSFVPESSLLADWHYLDPPGGLGGKTSYGYQKDESEIIVLRSALGAAVKINSLLSFGASVGLIYNENRLETPYVFQDLQQGPGGPKNSAYNGAKTLLNLHTSGFGYDAQMGLIFHPATNLQFGLSYQSETRVDTTGSASGDPSLQFGHPQGTLPFQYHANVRNIFPQEINGGLSWKFQPQWRLALQVDWVGWADAFHTLPVSLSSGNNATVNGVLGSSFKDLVPLNWKDELVYRAGVEYKVNKALSLRGGYCFGSSPVPGSTLTPLTAAIMENTLTAGIGYQWEHFRFDLAYQYSFPATQYVGKSGLLSGEYSNSSTEVSVHILALTTSIRF
jgi:long-chain fatty acid transport protein